MAEETGMMGSEVTHGTAGKGGAKQAEDAMGKAATERENWGPLQEKAVAMTGDAATGLGEQSSELQGVAAATVVAKTGSGLLGEQADAAIAIAVPESTKQDDTASTEVPTMGRATTARRWRGVAGT